MIGKSEADAAGKRPVTSAEALEILEDRKKADKLGYEQELAHDHIKKFGGISAEAAKKMKKVLVELGVSDTTAIKISDIMPIDIAQLKHILVLEKKNFDEDDIKKMMEVVESYKGK
jgi:DNA-directed RNA polymerase subunit F